MKNPKGEIGKVVGDANDVFRILTVEFEDGHKEELWLANMGQNPKESKDWEWLFEHEGKKKWVKWDV